MFSPCANAGVNINVPPVAVTSIATDNIAAAAKTVVKRILLFMLEFIECKYSYKLYNGYILSRYDNNLFNLSTYIGTLGVIFHNCNSTKSVT